MSSNPKANGFTLLEVLIAVAIMAGVVSVVYVAFFTSSRNVEQAETIRDATDMARTLMQRISNDVTNACYEPGMNTPQAAVTAFIGKRGDVQAGEAKSRQDSLTLTTLTNSRRPNTKETELWEVAYFFRQKADGTGSVLMRREKRELSKDVPAGEGGYEYEVTDRVRSLQLRYRESAAKQWVDEWKTSQTVGLPRFVEIALALDSGMTYSTSVEVGRMKQ